MRPKKLPPLEFLREYFKYCPDTGELFKIKKTAKRDKLGCPVGSLNTEGYLKVTIKGESYPVHRICYKLFYGEEPNIIDHVDGNGTNNRINNIRSVSYAVNNRNRKGVRGWSMLKNGRFRVCITTDGVTKDVGYYDTKEEASEAYRLARKRNLY